MFILSGPFMSSGAIPGRFKTILPILNPMVTSLSIQRFMDQKGPNLIRTKEMHQVAEYRVGSLDLQERDQGQVDSKSPLWE